MELKGNYTFDAPQNLVWEALNDPNVLGSVMPGSKGFTEVGDNEYEGKLKVKVGPVQGDFDATIALVDVNKPVSYTINVDGKGNVGYVQASGGINLSPADDNKTEMDYSGTAQISGRIASVGQRLMDSTARSIVRQSLNGLNEYLKLQAEQASATASATTSDDETDSEDALQETVAAETVVPEYQAPSEMEVGMNVMRDVLNDFIPRQYQPFVLAAIVIIVGLILLRIFV